jgi:hypothetical protein
VYLLSGMSHIVREFAKPSAPRSVATRTYPGTNRISYERTRLPSERGNLMALFRRRCGQSTFEVFICANSMRLFGPGLEFRIPLDASSLSVRK